MDPREFRLKISTIKQPCKAGEKVLCCLMSLLKLKFLHIHIYIYFYFFANRDPYDKNVFHSAGLKQIKKDIETQQKEAC